MSERTFPADWQRRRPRARLLVWTLWLGLVALIWALLLVAIRGQGLFARVVAIGLRSIGFIGKLLCEAMEKDAAVEAVTATGASRAQILDHGIVPQVLPAFWGITVFRWGIDIRESAMIGLAGAGGLGLEQQRSLNGLALAAGDDDHYCHPDDRRPFGMGLGKGSRRDHLANGRACGETGERP